MEDKPQTSVSQIDPPTVRHTLERRPGSLAVLSVDVDADRLKRATDRVFERHVRQARIPGFRPGKAPRAIYERTYGSEHLWAEAAEDVVDETYREIVQQERLDPLEQPQVEISRFEPGQNLEYIATMPIRPDVTLGDYAGPARELDVKVITDDDVKATIDRMREQNAQLQPVEREARDGDVVTIDVDLKVADKPAESFGRGAHLELGKPFSIAGFTEGIVGMKSGDERTLDLTFPDGYPDEALRGKPATFIVKVSQVTEPVLPALDDDFAKTVGVADLAALDKAVRGELAHGSFHEARDAAADRLLDELLASATVEMPDVLVEHELEHLVADLKDRVQQRRLPWEQFLLEARKTEDELRADFRPAAEKRAKSLLVLDAIAEKEGVGISSEELAQEVAMTPLAQQDARALRDPRVLSSMARSMRNRKVMDKLLGLAGPDAERGYLKKAGAPEGDEHDKPPEIIVPAERPKATAEGREALRQMLAEEEERPAGP